MRRFIFLVVGVFFLALPKVVLGADFVVEKFESEITINKDTSLTVEEIVSVNFSERRHGIFRDIPVSYMAGGRTINIRLEVLGVEDEEGASWQFVASRSGKNMRIKIGDPEKYVRGKQVYVIAYKVSGVIQRYEEHDELYWNVFGGDWEAVIDTGRVRVVSPWAGIVQSKCFYGEVGTKGRDCVESKSGGGEVEYESREELGRGRDMTVVVGLDKNSELIFPGAVARIGMVMRDNWGYVVAIVPMVYMVVSWWRKGRDRRYLSEGVYYEPDKKVTKRVSVFARKYLPMVYAPIDNLTPAEMGVIVDERVDMRDVVAEITELARLGYLKIRVTDPPKAGAFRRAGYVFTKLKKDTRELRDYQRYLYQKLFGSKREVKMSDLENKFYKHLGEFKKKLYTHVHAEGYFGYDPDKTRMNWFLRWLLVESLSVLVIFRFMQMTGNVGPFILVMFGGVLVLPLAFVMPRKTAKGYALHRQAKGLSFYVKKGKWRHEVNEKNMFFEEMLPLAISLGVVKKLAKDMEGLGARPPSYVSGANSAFVYSGLGKFDSSLGVTLASSPKSSGGSGFGGGAVGGGFGGGGGGSW